jgi:ATP-dependent Clp protease adapter protein ClpS
VTSAPTAAKAAPPDEALAHPADKPPRVASKTHTDDQSVVRAQPMPLYHTIVHNCDCHTFQDVIFGLMRIVGTGMRDAELKAREIDFFGRGIVATAPLEAAEHYAQRLHREVVSASGTLLRTSVEPAAIC